ncbi:IS110 family transposase [Leptolyngbya sp. KIOST-1]|uniref:IS110 family transposase n=1 Tax=Leptolyngbya sp. KIOST-1 TaxID=1229172 RepID=UPI00090781A2|nr:transposase [Leptolyngbya sp. KIOST-1]
MPSIIGVEVAKTSILCCAVDSHSIPGDLAQFARSYTPVTLLSNLSGVQTLLELGDIYVLEPTGDYSKIWIDTLKSNGKTVLRVNPKRVTALKAYSGVANKTDRYDAAFLALYGALNLDKASAFLSDFAEDLRAATLHHQFLTRMTGNHQRRLWQLLSHEWPEVCRTASGKKPQQNRDWLYPKPPALWRFIAGQPTNTTARRQAQLDATIGTGLTDLSRALAAQICELERQQLPYEEKISALLESSQFKPYHAVFNAFGFGEMTRAVILSRIYPLSQFLGEDGQPIKTKAPSEKGRYHRRNRSLGAFRLALGLGTQAYQSGQERRHKPAGSKVPPPRWA